MYLLFFFLLSFPSILFAQDGLMRLETIHIDSGKTEFLQNSSAAFHQVIEKEDLDIGGQVSLADVLKQIPFVDLKQGQGGATSSLYVRGLKSEHVAVLVDGVEFYDPSTIGSRSDLGSILLGPVERVEFIRGGQSSLFGTSALGGVLNIVTKPQQERSAYNLSLASTTDRKNNLGLYARQNYGAWLWSANLSYAQDKGYSVTNEGNDLEKDSIANLGINLYSRLKRENSLWEFFARANKGKADLDATTGTKDDPNYYSQTHQEFLKLSYAHRSNHKSSQNFSCALTKNKREYFNDSDENHLGESLREVFRGQILKAEFLQKWDWNSVWASQLGIETKSEKSSSYSKVIGALSYENEVPEKGIQNNALFLLQSWSPSALWSHSASLRLDHHSEFKNYESFGFSSFFKKFGGVLKFNWAQAFKSPSLYQLYSKYGNQDLQVEESQSWDLGVEKSFWHKRLGFEFVFFKTNLTQLIDYDSASSQFQNTGEASLYGEELSAKLALGDWSIVQLHYSQLNAKNTKSNEQLLRRAKHQAKCSWDFFWRELWSSKLEYAYMGEREDINSDLKRVKMPSYGLWNFRLTRSFLQQSEISLSVHNLFDKQYEELKSYTSPGRSVVLELFASF